MFGRGKREKSEAERLADLMTAIKALKEAADRVERSGAMRGYPDQARALGESASCQPAGAHPMSSSGETYGSSPPGWSALPLLL
jgi:hypothetical protein